MTDFTVLKKMLSSEKQVLEPGSVEYSKAGKCNCCSLCVGAMLIIESSIHWKLELPNDHAEHRRGS
jgi:hypothetical protein